MAKLILMFKDKILSTYPLAEGGTLTIGRHPDNDIAIENLSVSGHHARIEHRGNEIVLTDLGSKNGTLRNGEAVTNCTIVDKDTIVIGKHTLQADWTDTMVVEQNDGVLSGAAPSTDSDRTVIMQSPVLKEGSAAAPPPADGPHDAPQTSSGKSKTSKSDYLSFLSGGTGELILSGKQISIGKNGDADIVVEGLWGLLMGGPAAVITKQAGDYFLRYAGGLIKPKRNGSSIKGTVKLSHADVVAVGPVKVQIKLAERLAA